jgi:NADH:ubiquinone oxidoreductase subunit 6 (subunit J)
MDKNLLTQIVFYAFAVLTVGSAAVVVFEKSLIRAAFALLYTFVGVAGLYAFLGADFLAAIQMVVYVGGILVLLLFGVMLTHKMYDLKLSSESHQFVPSLLVVIAVFTILATFMLRTQWHNGGDSPVTPTTATIGKLFMNDYILPFEVASILLLIALIGAAMVVRRKSE